MAALLSDVPLHRQPLSAKQLVGRVIAFYFSAHWCPPCRRFTNILKTFYEEGRDRRSSFEIVFVSSDRSEDEMKEYLTLMPDWLHVPFGHPSIGQLSSRFHVSGIPTVVVVSPTGQIISKSGRSDIENRVSTAALLEEWLSSVPPSPSHELVVTSL